MKKSITLEKNVMFYKRNPYLAQKTLCKQNNAVHKYKNIHLKKCNFGYFFEKP